MRVNSDSIPEGPPWQPAVWSEGPDGLVSDATSALWQDQADIGQTLDVPERSISGGAPSMQNESEQVVNPDPGGSTERSGADPNRGRAQQWRAGINDMRRTEPLAAWANGTHSGPANPNA